MTTPTVLFLCIHNAGRSQMAAAFARSLGEGRITVVSAGSVPADRLNPAVVEAMNEVGLDISGETPRRVTLDDVRGATVVVTMGCGDECPFVPGVRYDDWPLADPAGQPVDIVRTIRDEIRNRVRSLIDEVAP